MASSRISAATLALLIAGFVLPVAAQAQEWQNPPQTQFEISGGMSQTSASKKTAVVSAAWLPVIRSFDNSTLRGEIGLVNVFRRKHEEDRHLDTNATVAHVGVRYDLGRQYGLTLGFGVGLVHGQTHALSGNPEFVSTVGWRFTDRFSILGRHISNAGIKKPNDGETMILAAWRF